MSNSIRTLATWLAGDFSNWDQAIENPPFFAHIRVCIRPLAALAEEGIWLYLEQAYDYMLQNPYRTAVLRLLPSTSPDYQIRIVNYKLKQPADFFGAARDRTKLASLTLAHLDDLPGCDMQVKYELGKFLGRVEPGKGCYVFRNGKNTYLSSEFEVTEHTYSSLDRGNDPETDERVWGSIAGAFEFKKTTSYADEVTQE